LAQEHSIDISQIAGTGPEGRIVRADIERAIEAGTGTPTPSGVYAEAIAGPPEPSPAEVYDGKRVEAVIPLKAMQRAIAEHMHQSLSVAAQLTDMGEIDMTAVIFVLAIAKALRDNRIINSSLIEDRIRVWQDINVGVAVATEQDGRDGLIVPVVRNADRKPLPQISRELKSLIEKARAGALMPDEVSGGTFTLTNMGAFGGVLTYSTPIINQPQSGILSMVPIIERPVVRDGQIVIRPIMTFNFTYDHRVVLGAAAGRFTARVAQLLESPSLLLL
jgi:pyruvate dehydrogenase E2 component (dihydrolipoamide acetyltransferase)